MGGMVVPSILVGSQVALGAFSGMQQGEQYKLQAKQAEMDAKTAELDRRRELQDALAMQAVMFGAQGREAGVGSAKEIMTEDRRRASEDIEMIQSAGRAKAQGLRSAAKIAPLTSIMGSGLSGATQLYSFSQVE